MIGPSTSLLRALAAWTAAALLVVVAPSLAPLVWSALIAIALVVAWDAWLLARGEPVLATRTLPERAFVGQDLEVGITITNPGSYGLHVDVIDEAAEDLCRSEPRLNGVAVMPHASTVVGYRVQPEVRGNRPFASLVTISGSPLGLLRRRVIHRAAALLRVYPDAARLHREGLLDASQRMVQAGIKSVRRRGEGMEFESLRDYVDGDDPRRVHWGASARRGRAVVRLSQHEADHAVMMVVDTSRLMGVAVQGRSKLDYAIDASLALSFSALAHGDRVGMATFDARVNDLLAPRASRGQFAAIVDRLQPLAYSPCEANYRDLVKVLSARQRRRALIIVLTDFAEIDPESLAVPLLALSRQHRVVVAALRDPVFLGLDPHAGEDTGTLPLYRRLVLDDLARTRELVLSQLRRRGILTIDAIPQALSASLVNQYLSIRYGPER